MFGPLRLYSQVAEKPYLELVAELRKLPEVSTSKTCESLRLCNDVPAAHVASGPQKTAKVAHRTASEGPRKLGASVLGRGTGHGDGSTQAALVYLTVRRTLGV